jgi:hypothetical protein
MPLTGTANPVSVSYFLFINCYSNMKKSETKAGVVLSRGQMKHITGGKAAFYYTYWKCSIPGGYVIDVCHYTDPSDNFCAGDATTCVYTNKPCMYAVCF